MATYYWVAGTGTWDAATTTHWATSSGGSGGAGVPTATDDVIFNSASSAAAYTVTIGTGALANNVTMGQPASGTLALASTTGTLTVSGSWSNTNTINGFQGTITFNSSNPGNTINHNGANYFGCQYVFNGTGSWTLLSNSACVNPIKNLVITQGSIYLNNFWLGGYAINSSNTNTRFIDFGTSGYIYWVCSTLTNLFCTWNFTNLTIAGTPKLTYFSSATGAGTNQLTFSNVSESNAFSLDFSGTTTTSTFRLTGTNIGVKNLDLSQYKALWYVTSLERVTVYGNFIGNSTSIANFSNLELIFGSTASDEKIIDFAGKSFNFANVKFVGGGTAGTGSFKLANTMNNAGSLITSSIYFTGGSFNANNFNVIGPVINISSSNARTLIMGNGEWRTVSTSAGIPSWDCTDSSNLTIVANSATINISTPINYSSPDTFNVIFSGGNTSWPTLKNNGLSLVIKGSNYFENIIKSSAISNTYIAFEAGTTTTVNGLAIDGVSGSQSNIKSTISGTQFTITKSSGTVNTNYVTIKDSSATGGANWFSYTSNGNINGGNNSGWMFAMVSNKPDSFFIFFDT